MAKGIIAGNKNIINKDDLATLRNFILGNGVFINSSIDNNFSESHTSKQITIGKGCICAYGVVGVSTSSVKFDFVNANTEQKWFIYVELDMSKLPNACEVKRINNGRSSDRKFRQDMLSNETSGVFQFPIWLVTVTREGISEVEDLRSIGAYVLSIGDYRLYISTSIPEYIYSKYTFDPNTGEFSFNETDMIHKSEIVVGKDYYAPDIENANKIFGFRHPNYLLYYIRDIYAIAPENATTYTKPYYVEHANRAISLNGTNPIIDSTVEAVTQIAGDNSEFIATTEFVKTELENM